jgi:hypothetical protein
VARSTHSSLLHKSRTALSIPDIYFSPGRSGFHGGTNEARHIRDLTRDVKLWRSPGEYVGVQGGCLGIHIANFTFGGNI